MISILLIKPNNKIYDNKEILKKNINDDLKEITEYITIENDKKKIMDYIIFISKIKENEKEYIQTCELKTYFNMSENKYSENKYYLFYTQYNEKTINENNIEKNIIAEKITHDKEIIYGNVIIIKIYNNNNIEDITNITTDHIYKLIKNGYFHNSILITTKEIKSKNFINNPIYQFNKFETSMYENINFMGFNLHLYFSLNSKYKNIKNINKINKYGTIIKKYSDIKDIYPIYGPVLITLQKDENYIYITKKIFNLIMLTISNINKNNISTYENLSNILENLTEINFNIPEDILYRQSLNSIFLKN